MSFMSVSKKIAIILSVNVFFLFSSMNAQAGLFGLHTSSVNSMNPSVWQLAVQAYQSAIHTNIEPVKPILTIIDYSLPSTENRLWVVDMRTNKILFNTLVAHGQGSGGNVANHFSNQFGTLASSIGVFLTKETYFGKRGYSLKIKGLEKGFNENAEQRHIVMHPAWYVNHAFAKAKGSLGRSWGCPALEQEISKPIIDTIKNGTLVFAYYPDANWLQKSRFLHRT